jgi:diamine N-acetyltransferase
VKLGVWESDSKRYTALGIPLEGNTDCTLAPSVSDNNQSHGIGSVMMQYILMHVKDLGWRRMALWGGVQALNDRAVHFYTKHGFVKVNEFVCDDLLNYDMILNLYNEIK